jgi:hypothetical protein
VLGVPTKTRAIAGYTSFVNSKFVVRKTRVVVDAIRFFFNIENANITVDVLNGMYTAAADHIDQEIQDQMLLMAWLYGNHV